MPFVKERDDLFVASTKTLHHINAGSVSLTLPVIGPALGHTLMPSVWSCLLFHRARILVQVTIYRRLRIGRDGHLDQSGDYYIS